MRDIKIYLHTNTTKLQAFIHVVAATCFFMKASRLPLNLDFYLFWFIFYISFGILLGIAALFQAVTNFGSRHLAAILNILAGVVLVVESMIRVSEESKRFYLLNFSAGLLFILVGVFEDRIRKIPYIIFGKQKIYGRRSLVSYFSYTWDDITDVNFKHNRIKIIRDNGQEIRYRVARQSVGGILIKSAEYLSNQIIKQKQKATEKQVHL